MASWACLSLSEGNWNTLTPFSCAATLRTSAFAPSFSGAQNTPATWSPRARNASRTALPKSCWPMIAIFISSRFLGRDREGARLLEARDLPLVVAQHLPQDLVGVLAEHRRALDHRGRGRELDRHADVVPLAPLGMVELDPHVATAHVLVAGEILGRHDRAARHIEGVENRHELALGVLLCELVEKRPDEILVLATFTDRRHTWISREVGHAYFGADALCEILPHRFLHDDVEPVVGPVRLAVDGVAELASAGVVAGTRDIAHVLIGRHRVFRQRSAREALVVAELHAAQVHHTVHHRHLDVLPLAGLVGLAQRGEQPDREVQPGARVADLRARDEGRTVGEIG